MAEETNQAGGTPPAGDPTAPPAGSNPPPSPADGAESISLEAARKLRQENQSLRERAKRADELEAADKKRQEAELSEAQKAQKRIEEAEARAQAAEARARDHALSGAVRDAATRLRFNDPGDALALLNKADLAVDETTGEPDPDKLEKALAALLKRKPYLAGSATPPPPRGGAGAPTNGAGAGSNPAGTYTKSQIADRKFWTENRDAILLAMREGRIIEG